MCNTFRALNKDDVEIRVQSANKDGFILLVYKNARVDQNILDDTFGPFKWQNKYEEYKGNLYCSIGIKAEEGEWVWKSNCGTESNTDKEKGEASDAFKRAGFNWGIGRELYTAPKMKAKGGVKARLDSEKKPMYDKQGKQIFDTIYYDFDCLMLETAEEPIRHISAITVLGKSMDGGEYYEDVVFSWSEKKGGISRDNTVSNAPKAHDEKEKELTLEEARAMTTSKGTPLYKLDAERLQFIIDKSQQPQLVKAAVLVLDELLTPIDNLTENDGDDKMPWD